MLSGTQTWGFLAIDKKALVRPIPVDSLMTGLDILWILSFINWHRDWVCPRRKNIEKEKLYETH